MLVLISYYYRCRGACVFQMKETDDNDMITFLIEEIGKKYPTLVETLVYERDK